MSWGQRDTTAGQPPLHPQYGQPVAAAAAPTTTAGSINNNYYAPQQTQPQPQNTTYAVADQSQMSQPGGGVAAANGSTVVDTTGMSEYERQQYALAQAAADRAKQSRDETCGCDVWRWVLFVFVFSTVALSAVAIYFEKWYMSGSTEAGALYNGWSSSVKCADGTAMTVGERMIIIFAMAVTGGGSALIAIFFIFFTCGGAAVTWLRHVFLFMSFGGWATAIIMMAMNYAGCGTAFLSFSSLGTSFWLGVGAGGAALVALCIDLIQHLIQACCSSGAPAAAAAPGAASTTSTAQADQQMQPFGVGQQQQQQQQPQNPPPNQQYPQQPQPTQQQQYEEAIRALDYSQQHADGSFTDVAAAFDPEDCTSVGLDAAQGWYYDHDSKMWWSDEAALYYDHNTRQYADPATGKWTNENGEWEE